MYKVIRFLLIIFLLSPGFVLIGDQMPDPDTESTVPELIDFHDIIYPIWHTAFPAKDYQALRGFLPEIEAGMARINAAVLPGILRDKKQVWESGLAEFNGAVDAYRKAAAGTDDQALLDAAELLHMRFEMQVRAIRPVAREVDAYHKVLYVVYPQVFARKKIRRDRRRGRRHGGQGRSCLQGHAFQAFGRQDRGFPGRGRQIAHRDQGPGSGRKSGTG